MHRLGCESQRSSIMGMMNDDVDVGVLHFYQRRCSFSRNSEMQQAASCRFFFTTFMIVFYDEVGLNFFLKNIGATPRCRHNIWGA